MSQTLQQLRATWRPALGRDARWLVVGATAAGFIVMLIRPDAGAAVVALVGLVYGYAASLAGIRQWGKNAGVVDT
jgi:hypothetical protein